MAIVEGILLGAEAALLTISQKLAARENNEI